MSEVVVVPLKAFDRAKARLRTIAGLDVDALARDLARAVIHAAAPRTCVVVTEDAAVAAFAAENGAEPWTSDASSLNEALSLAWADLRRRFSLLVVAPGDLREPGGLGAYDFAPGATLVADQRGEGTNVLALPGSADFSFAYGVGSFSRHLAAARAGGLAVTILSDSPWRYDIDDPHDLEAARTAIEGALRPPRLPTLKES